jgi:general secretion pathway protein K
MERRDGGFVLVSVLWIVLFLALAAATFTLAVRTHVRDASTEAAAAEARVLAEAGVNLALHDLVNARQTRNWKRRFPPDGRAHACGTTAGRIAVAVEDEAGKVDLNAAPEALLSLLMIGVGVSPDDAKRLAAAIADFRDRDDNSLPGGAEAEDYAKAGRGIGPKNAPFDSTAELAQVLGFDSGLVGRLLPFVTVHSELPGIDMARASPALMEVLGGGTGGTARLPAELRAISPQRVFRITSTAMTEQDARFARRAIVRIAPSRSRHFSVLVWQQVDAKEQPIAADLGPC